jgi:hypothetical protein
MTRIKTPAKPVKPAKAASTSTLLRVSPRSIGIVDEIVASAAALGRNLSRREIADRLIEQAGEQAKVGKLKFF